MKFSCLQENFSQAINTVGHLALRAGSLPVLTNISIKTGNGGVVFTATNLEAGIVHLMRGKVSDEGECLVPSRLLLDLVPLLAEGPIEVELKQEGLMLTTENTSSTLRIHPTSDFPIIPSIDEGHKTMSVPRANFVAALASVMGAAGKAENRPQFNGVLFVADQALTLAATDGFRLAETKIDVHKATTARAIVPLATAQEIARILGSAEEDEHIEIHLSENQIKVATSVTSIISRLIEGEYPDYLPLFPAKPSTSVRIDSAVLGRALKASTLFSRAGLSTVTLEVSPTQKMIQVSAESGDVGAHSTTLPCEGEGEDVRTVVNTRFVLEGLQNVHGRATLHFTSGDRPMLITPEKESALHYRYLVMPIRQ